ncbi:MAG: hypothetical protein GX060_03320 [Firmicutes bacterium]|nr:hypothetical protein [Bacillota bacterium]
MAKPERTADLPEILRFFAPLALTWMLMMFTHTIIGAGLARSANPTISTAAYAIALSLGEIFEAPLVMIRQTGIAFISNHQSFRAVRQVTLTTIAIFMVITSAIAYIPPLTRLVFQDILGVSADLIGAAIMGFRVTMFFPIVSGLRSLYQSIILANKRTAYIPIGVLVRVTFVSLTVYSLMQLNLLAGTLVGAIAIVGAVAAEAIPANYFGRRLLPQTGSDADPILSTRAIWRFYIPLIGSSLFVAMGKPFINAGLTRMADAAISLAAFNIALSLTGMITSPLLNLHQVTMVFGRAKENLPLVRKFAFGVALISSALLFLIAYSPLGVWILTGPFNIPAELLRPVLYAARVLAFFPLLIGWVEYNTGLLLLGQATGLGCEGLTLQLGKRILRLEKAQSRPANS